MEKKIAGVKNEGSMGRPREFDTDAALDKAMRLFWMKSYEGTSVADLTGTLGISRPSLYAAFGDKQSLFRAALERYAAGPARYVTSAARAADGPRGGTATPQGSRRSAGQFPQPRRLPDS